MNKPTIFFSHSSKDKTVLMQLKVMFQEKTGGSIDLFLSSDGQSIPLGRNWVHKVQEGLEAAAIMVVFLTPASVSSQWVYFEAGFAYCKGIRVIPVGFLGVDLAKVNPPLGLLQGFNIKSKDGLDNLIAMTNAEFKHDHKNRFDDDEYNRLINLSQYPASESTADALRILGEVRLDISFNKDELVPEVVILLEQASENPPDVLSLISATLAENKVAHSYSQEGLLFHGVHIDDHSRRWPELRLKFFIDPLMLTYTAPILERILRSIRKNGFRGLGVILDLIYGVNTLEQPHKISARLYGTLVKLQREGPYDFKDVAFSARAIYRKSPASLYLNMKEDSFPVSTISDLLQLLIERKIVFYEEHNKVS